MTSLPAASLPGGIDGPGAPDLVCTACGTANDLIVEGIEATVPAVSGLVSIEYSCSACDCFYGHDATLVQVATLLEAGATAPGVLPFGHLFIHCGEPMEDMGDGISPLNRPALIEDGPASAMSMRTRLLKCDCGFQLEVPLP